MKKITKSNKNIFFKGILPLLLLLSFIFNPSKVFAEVAETEINGELINASSEFLRDLDFETWQLVAYKSSLFENKLSERRKRLHDLLLTLINKDSEFEFVEEDSNDLTSSYSEKDTLNLSRVIEKNRKIIKRYQAIVRTAVTLDALMDYENDENYKIK